MVEKSAGSFGSIVAEVAVVVVVGVDTVAVGVGAGVDAVVVGVGVGAIGVGVGAIMFIKSDCVVLNSPPSPSGSIKLPKRSKAMIMLV